MQIKFNFVGFRSPLIILLQRRKHFDYNLVHVEFHHFDSLVAESVDFHEEASWVGLVSEGIDWAGGDEHGVQVLSSEFASSQLLDVHLDLLLNLAVTVGGRTSLDEQSARCSRFVYLHGVNFDDLATSEHAQVEIVVLIDGHAAAEDLLGLTILADVEENLLVV